MKITHYQRKPRPKSNFSLEYIFSDVRNRLQGIHEFEVLIAPYVSNGVRDRLLICRDVAKWGRANIHITGDINFAILGARKGAAILTVLDCGFIHRSSGVKRQLLKKLWLEFPVRRSAVTTTISNDAVDDIVRFSGCSREKVHLISVAISPDFVFTPQAFNSTKPRILHIGAALNKNLERHIQALKGIPCKLVIVGACSHSILRLLKENKIEYENYENLSNAEVVEQYRRSDLLLFASTGEGFGMPILEAQATGRPVVTSKVSSMPEVAGDAAVLVDPLDTDSIREGVNRVISDHSLRAELIEAGRKNVTRFDPQSIAYSYHELYEAVWGKGLVRV